MPLKREPEAADRPPAADNALFAGLPVGIVGFEGKACFDDEVQAGPIAEAVAEAEVLGTSGASVSKDQPGKWTESTIA